MATAQDFVDYIFEQAGLGSRLTAKKMFGEFGLYLDEKIIALACDNQLFIKPTEPGRALLGKVKEGAPYPGAKPHLLVNELLDDGDLLKQVLVATAKALPAPKPKAAKATKTTKKAAARPK